MKKILIIVFLFPLLIHAQKNINIGPGVLKIDRDKAPVLQFYTDTNQITVAKTITLIKDKKNGISIKNYPQVESWFQPEALYLEYNVFFIRVDTIAGKWYRVFVNNEKGTTMWIKAGQAKKFVKWETFLLKETTSIDKLPDFTPEIKAAVSDSSKTIKKIEKADCFEVLEVKGDWIRIRTNTHLDCSESNKPIRSGWIRWRRNNRLTIGYGLVC